MPDAKKLLPYNFYFDNLFTSIKLNHLASKGYGVTFIMLGNRVDKNSLLPDAKSSRKRSRGTISYLKSEEDDVVHTRKMDRQQCDNDGIKNPLCSSDKKFSALYSCPEKSNRCRVSKFSFNV